MCTPSKHSPPALKHDTVFTVEMLGARHGDCLWLEYGPADRPNVVLIDGGPLSSFDALERRILQLPPDRRELELLVVTHIDSDHIAGIVRLLNRPDLGLSFKEIWFNGWQQLRMPIVTTPKLSRAPATAATRSPMEGAFLGERIKRSGRPWNASFGGRAIYVGRGVDPPTVTLDGGLKLTLLSPDEESLRKLRDAWAKALNRRGLQPDDTAGISSRLDRDARYRSSGATRMSSGLVAELNEITEELDAAVANASSIAFLAEFNDRRCAFLADAHAPVVESALRRLTKSMGEARLRVDATKVSHHGSSGNTTHDLLKLLDCRQYLISTDGSQFGHPDDEAVARIVQQASKPLRLFFNYRSDRTKKWDEDPLKKDLGYDTRYAEPGTGLVVDLMLAD